MSSPPDADTILQRDDVADGSFEDLFRQGLRGALYGGALFVISIFTGLTEILVEWLSQLANGVAITFSSFFEGSGDLITAGATRTTESFLLPSFLGWVEGLVWVVVGVYVIRLAMSLFSTDIFVLPGFDIIPNIGSSQDGSDDDE